MADGIKITVGDGELLSTFTTSSSAVTFNGFGFQKITFDGDTFDSMDAFYEHVRRLRAENSRIELLEAMVARLVRTVISANELADAVDALSKGGPEPRDNWRRVFAALEAYQNTTGDDDD